MTKFHLDAKLIRGLNYYECQNLNFLNFLYRAFTSHDWIQCFSFDNCTCSLSWGLPPSQGSRRMLGPCAARRKPSAGFFSPSFSLCCSLSKAVTGRLLQRDLEDVGFLVASACISLILISKYLENLYNSKEGSLWHSVFILCLYCILYFPSYMCMSCSHVNRLLPRSV